MKLKTISTSSDMKLTDVSVEFVTIDKKIIEIIIRSHGDEDGYSIKPGPSYSESLNVFQRVEFEYKTIHRLSGTVLGGKFQQDFDTPEEAGAAADRLRNRADGEAELTVVEIKALLKEDGSTVGDFNDAIPF